MKKLITTTICILLISGMAAQISIIGTATPANDWSTDVFMTQDPDNSSLWSITVNLTNHELKFRENGSWTDNWGGNGFPSGYGVPNGTTNITVTTSGNYFITFNTETLIYNFTLLSAVSTGISHQAVIRNATGELISSVPVGIKVSIIQVAPDGSTVYSENHTVLTNVNGLISFVIGQGTVISGVFTDIDWSDGPYFTETKADPSGGTNYTIEGISQMLSVPYALHAQNAKTYKVGDFEQGGIVFWVDETSQHGLVAAKEDQSTGVRWYAGTFGNTQAKGDGPFAGEANTSIIIAAQVAIGDDNATYAARICNELQVTEGGKNYGDWYLPSKEELNLMYQNKATIDATAGSNGGSAFASDYYWSSSEDSSSDAWVQYFLSGNQYLYLKYYTTRVRAVRAF